MAASSPRLIPGRCQIDGMRANVAVQVEARRPHVDGPLRSRRLRLPAEPVRDRRAAVRHQQQLQRELHQLRRPRPDGDPDAGRRREWPRRIRRQPDLPRQSRRRPTARSSSPRSARGWRPSIAERTRLEGRYRLGTDRRHLRHGRRLCGERRDPRPVDARQRHRPAGRRRRTPIGPVATAIGNAIRRTASEFDAAGEIRMVNFPGGGAARIETAEVTAPNGARVRVSGGDGVTYYWPTRPAARRRADRDGRRRPAHRAGSTPPAAQRRADERRCRVRALPGRRSRASRWRRSASPPRATARPLSSTVAVLDGPFPDGRVQALRVPLTGRFGADRRFAVRHRLRRNQLGLSAVPRSSSSGRRACRSARSARRSCRSRPAATARWGARLTNPVLTGRLGNSPLAARRASGADRGQAILGSTRSALRLGRPASPLDFRRRAPAGHFRRPRGQRHLLRRPLDDRQRAAGDERHRRALARLRGRPDGRRRA